MATKEYKWLVKITASVGLLGVMYVASGVALADTYNIILKDAGGAIQTCATGGFSFTKTTVGTSPASGASVTLNGSTAIPCFGTDQANEVLSNGALNVTVANVTLNGQDQGPNVTSLSGSLSSGNGSNNYTITFAGDKTFTITQNTGQNPQVGSGVYFLYNVNSVPEPETLWLALAGLSALALSRRRRRRN